MNQFFYNLVQDVVSNLKIHITTDSCNNQLILVMGSTARLDGSSAKATITSISRTCMEWPTILNQGCLEDFQPLPQALNAGTSSPKAQYNWFIKFKAHILSRFKSTVTSSLLVSIKTQQGDPLLG